MGSTSSFIRLVCVGFLLVMFAPRSSSLGQDNRLDGYRGIWFTLGQFSKHGDKYSGGLGTYTSSHNPLAVYSPEVDRTFFTYGGTTQSDQRHLLIMVSYFDHKTGTVPKPVVVHDKQGVDDPHDNASLQLDEHGYVWVFISGRGRNRPGFIYRSEAPWSIDRFQLVREAEMTYPQPWYSKRDGWLHLFTKYTKGRELYWETSRDGLHWSETKKLAGIGGHYQVSEYFLGTEGNEKIGTFFNYHPGGNVDKRTNLYYMETRDGGETWVTADGRPLTVPLTEITNPALVIDYVKEGLNQYACDLHFDSAGNPVLLYVTSQGHEPGPENNPRVFRLTRWTGSEWKTQIIGETDHNYDMGSIYVAGDHWRILIPCRPGPQSWGGGGEVVWMESRDGGATWSEPREVTQGSSLNHNYIRRPRQAQDPFYAFWADGNPDRFSPSRLYFTDSQGDKVWRLPGKIDGEFGTPELVPRN
ncbi:BNR-4 repeat-containing protein [Pirellulaceae bacterium SH467]